MPLVGLLAVTGGLFYGIGWAFERAQERIRQRMERELADARHRELATTGLAGFCPHGIGMLDQCDDCCPEEATT